MKKLTLEELVMGYQLAGAGFYKDDLLAEVIERVSGMIVNVSKNYRFIPNIDIDDKILELRMELLKAINYFDNSKGFKFSTICKAFFTQRLNKLLEYNTTQKRYDEKIKFASFEAVVDLGLERKPKKTEVNTVADVVDVDSFEQSDFTDMLASLNMKEKEKITCELTMQGKTKSEISRELGCTPAMVKNYLNNIGRRMIANGCY